MGVLLERSGVAAIVKMDWAESRNALGLEETRELTDVVSNAAADPSICGVIITGNESAFSSGGNIRGVHKRLDMPEDVRRRAVYGSSQALMRALLEVPVPTVAAIDGPAIGMGLDLALYCDSRFVGPKGWIMQGWGRIGLIPATGGELLIRLLSPGTLWHLLEEQPRIGQDEAVRLNLAESSGTKSALDRAVERIQTLSTRMAREQLETYVGLYRADLQDRLTKHLEAALEGQLKALRHPEFKARSAKAMSGESSS